MPYLAYGITVFDAGFASETALRRAPTLFRALARELRLRNAETQRDMLNADQARHLADVIRSMSEPEQKRARSYAQAAQAALTGLQTNAVASASPPTDVDQVVQDELDPVTEESHWMLPTLDVLDQPDKPREIPESMIRAMEQRLQATLNSFKNVRAEVRPEYTKIAPRILRFGILPTGKPVMKADAPKRDATGRIVYETLTPISAIEAREHDIQAALEATSIRMLKPVPGTSHVGVEIPNPYPAFVTLREILESEVFRTSPAKLPVALGKDMSGQVRVIDLAATPHLLIAGATGAGKSVVVNAVIDSLLMQFGPDEVRMWMIDPKMVELTVYNGIPHLCSPVVIESDKAVQVLDNAIREMDRRYRLFSQLGVRNHEAYHKLRVKKLATGDRSLAKLPSIVLVIDELADLMMAAREEVEGKICRLAQLARATAIHLVIATQRPSVDVITGLIKANIPTRIALMVSSAVDSRTILDIGGAEHLLGKGDMLFQSAESAKPDRVQGAFVSDDEATAIADFWRGLPPASPSEPDDLGAAIEDEEREKRPDEGVHVAPTEKDDDESLIEQATDFFSEQRKASVSALQRRFRIGFGRATRIMEALETRGIVGPPQGKQNIRAVLISPPAPDQEEEHSQENSSALP